MCVYYYCGNRREREDSAVVSLNYYYYHHYTMRTTRLTRNRFTVCWRWTKIAHNYNVIGIFQRK